MIVTVTQVTKGGKIKTVVGRLLQDGFAHVAILVTNKDGTQSIKRFSKSKYGIRFIKEGGK